MYKTINEEAWELIHTIAGQCSENGEFGTMSASAYDTAWVAMIRKNTEDGEGEFLFPEAYEYLKDTQNEDGTWAADISDVDGIVNTLAALLALKRQSRLDDTTAPENEPRCERAERGVRRLLNGWDIQSTDRVGLEILVPNLLRLLETEGLHFEFPSRKALMHLNGAKLARLGPILTSPTQTTLIHTLEAFAGILDFDKVKHHRMPNGSMLGSPSSTAAYLMNATEWDNESEAYLKQVFAEYSKMGHRGGFPSAFPSTLFEITWILELLIESDFSMDDFLLEDKRRLTFTLQSALRSQQGILGFALNSLPDADCTAKAISTLRLLGWNPSVEPLLKAFEAETSFITYQGERNASTTANCNILLCLLRAPEPAEYTRPIVKCVNFLTKAWMANCGPDKWHTSVLYPMMLVAQAFTSFLERWGKGQFRMDLVPDSLVQGDIPRTLLNILGRVMSLQQEDGSWESKREVTAYGILTLASLLRLPWVEFLRPEGKGAILRGKAYLQERRHLWRQGEIIWIEKTAYSSSNLAQAYCLAASKIEIPTSSLPQKVSSLIPQSDKKTAMMRYFFSKIVPFTKSPPWKLQLSLMQSNLYSSALKDKRFSIFPLMPSASDEKYLEYIPFTWVGCKDVLSTPMSSEALWEMMLVSMYNFQVDAYMESAVWDAFKNNLDELKLFIKELCCGEQVQRKRKREDEHSGPRKKVNGSNGVLSPNGDLNGVNGTCANGANGHLNVEAKVATVAATNGSNGEEARQNSVNSSNGVGNGVNSPNGVGIPELAEIKTVLTSFVSHALQHPKVLQSSPSLRSWLAYELQTFLLAHIAQMEDCASMPLDSEDAQGNLVWEHPRSTYFNWVRTTSSDHTSCPYSFVFYLCLIGEPGTAVIQNVQQRYILENACRHLAIMCRQYNDFGSVVRDFDEKNLNSVNFPEFHDYARGGQLNKEEKLDKKKRELLEIAQYERRGLDRAVGELKGSLDKSVMEKLELFIQVTDLYGQIYVARDIGIRKEMEKAAEKKGQR